MYKVTCRICKKTFLKEIIFDLNNVCDDCNKGRNKDIYKDMGIPDVLKDIFKFS